MDWRLNTQHLEQYESVFRTRGFRKASRELSISHNTIRKNIDLLEQRIGKPLFASKSKPLQFTPLGEKIGQCLVDELKLLTRLNSQIQTLSQLPTEVVVGIPAIESAYALHAHLIQFANQNPSVSVEFAGYSSLEDIASGRIHVGLFIDRPSRENTIAPDDLVGGIRVDVLHAFYTARGAYPEKLIGGYTDEEWDVLDQLILPDSIVTPSRHYGIQSATERSQLATAGYGIACLPSYGKEHDPTLIRRSDLPEIALHSLNIGMSQLFKKSKAHCLIRSFLIDLLTGDPERLFAGQSN
jgi:DNA-binding transcriptional LysR family regulator